VAGERPTTPEPEPGSPKILHQACFFLPIWFEGYVTLLDLTTPNFMSYLSNNLYNSVLTLE